jgi:benzoate/toluate 1,2-dioxygenase reductase subunit
MDRTTFPGEVDSSSARAAESPAYRSRILRRRWLCAGTLEIELDRPSGFTFVPGQRIRLFRDHEAREYSLASAPGDPFLLLCVRVVQGGRFTPWLASCPEGSEIAFSGPCGYFVYRRSSWPACFVATGTGIAPFVSMARSGLSGFTLLHGVRFAEEVYYREVFESRSALYVPCLSSAAAAPGLPRGAFPGRVTEYAEKVLSGGPFDFYLCGNRDMVRDMTRIVDERFEGSRVFVEVFF